MLWRFIIAGTKECFEGHKHPQPPPKNTSASLGVVAHPFDATARARGPFLLAVAMVVAVVMPVVFYAKATEKRNKNTKISWWLPKSLFITIYVKHIVIHTWLIVAWPEPELWHGRSPNHYGPMDPGILGIAGKLLSLRE
jgi:hypothetical protein